MELESLTPPALFPALIHVHLLHTHKHTHTRTLYAILGWGRESSSLPMARENAWTKWYGSLFLCRFTYTFYVPPLFSWSTRISSISLPEAARAPSDYGSNPECRVTRTNTPPPPLLPLPHLLSTELFVLLVLRLLLVHLFFLVPFYYRTYIRYGRPKFHRSGRVTTTGIASRPPLPTNPPTACLLGFREFTFNAYMYNPCTQIYIYILYLRLSLYTCIFITVELARTQAHRKTQTDCVPLIEGHREGRRKRMRQENVRM